jgi:hypothetical protein
MATREAAGLGDRCVGTWDNAQANCEDPSARNPGRGLTSLRKPSVSAPAPGRLVAGVPGRGQPGAAGVRFR